MKCYIVVCACVIAYQVVARGGGEGILPCFSYILGMCRLIGYVFRGVLSLNRVSSLVLSSFGRVPKSQALIKP